MRLPVDLPVTPMLATSVRAVPAPDSVEGGWSFEPKWDGFRCVIARDGDEVMLGSRSGKALDRYFPEVVEAVFAHLPSRCVVDGELVVRSGAVGAQRLDWEALSARVHPAASRVARLARESPAEFVAFDLLALGQESLVGEPFARRREALTRALAGADGPFHVTAATGDAEVARDWFERFEGAGLDGVVAKPLAGPYTPGKRTMLKVKHARTADAVVIGYRVHASGEGVGSLLLGLVDEEGRMRSVGGVSAFTAARRRELLDELAPLVVRDADGAAARAEGERSRFSSGRDVSFVPLRPERVVEVAFDQLEGDRFRHAVQFVRWRPDRDPASCTLAQIDVAPAYDLDEVLTAG